MSKIHCIDPIQILTTLCDITRKVIDAQRLQQQFLSLQTNNQKVIPNEKTCLQERLSSFQTWILFNHHVRCTFTNFIFLSTGKIFHLIKIKTWNYSCVISLQFGPKTSHRSEFDGTRNLEGNLAKVKVLLGYIPN